MPGSHLRPLELPGLLWVPESCIFNTLRVILVCGRDAGHLSLSVLSGNINKTQDLQTSGELLRVTGNRKWAFLKMKGCILSDFRDWLDWNRE